MAKAKKIIQEKKDLATLDAKELNIELQTARKLHFSLAMKHSTWELKQPHLLRISRKNIAQIATALSSVSL